MNRPSIRVDLLSKRYRVGSRPVYQTLRDRVALGSRHLLRYLARPWNNSGEAARDEYLWALREVSFEISQGEVVGIIGRNGAGKSTLLKVLSRITSPSSGSVEIRGRVGSLLEVGTGFHRELTGRENIYLNGAILGMRKTEIDHKFDEIIAFAEVERFVDTPIKHYSSGMHVRLAFAVAAYLEPEILLVDEVLAVGDVRFQKKCLNKMQDVSRMGRTVLFVSHNMSSITRLCDRAILLEDGSIAGDGPAHRLVSAYLNNGLGTTAQREWPDPARAPGGAVARLRAVRVRSAGGEITDAVDIREAVAIEMEYDVLKAGYVLLPHHHLMNEQGVHVFSTHDLDPVWRGRPRDPGRWISTVWVPGNFLSEGTLFVWASIITLDPVVAQFYEKDAVSFQVVDSLNGDSARGDWAGEMGGAVRPLLNWETRCLPFGSARETVRRGRDDRKGFEVIAR